MISPGFFTYFAIVSWSLVLDGRSRISQVFNTCTWVSEYSGFGACIFHEIRTLTILANGPIECILLHTQWIGWSLALHGSDCALFLLFSCRIIKLSLYYDFFPEILAKIKVANPFPIRGSTTIWVKSSSHPLHILTFMLTNMYDVDIEWKIASEHRACFGVKSDIDYDTW